jgi:hypothetical protein
MKEVACRTKLRVVFIRLYFTWIADNTEHPDLPSQSQLLRSIIKIKRSQLKFKYSLIDSLFFQSTNLPKWIPGGSLKAD